MTLPNGKKEEKGRFAEKCGLFLVTQIDHHSFYISLLLSKITSLFQAVTHEVQSKK